MARKTNSPKRIGIYSGTFDPVHAGHVGFALQAMQSAGLDAVFFLPERRPRGKAGVEHFGHRVAMLRRAVKPYQNLGVLELEDVGFSIATTLPRLRTRFPKAELVFLVGSDVATHMQVWPNVEQLFKQSELVVGVRSGSDIAVMKEQVSGWRLQPLQTMVIESHAAAVSSGLIRDALRKRTYVPGLLKSVERYSNRNWLYVSLAQQVK
jgi:nicotinate-nucleotide adenylyltransferase